MYLEAATYTREKLTPDKWCGLDLILKAQPYITDVLEWKREGTNYCLNDFRAHMFHALRKPHTAQAAKEKHLTHWMADAHGVPYSCMDEPWLTLDPNPVAKVIFSRSGPGRPAHNVYQSLAFPWHRAWEKYRKDAVFIGTDLEWEVFCAAQGNVTHYKTNDLFEAARVIAGCELFVGNQSAPHVIAQGCFKRVILEVWEGGANSSCTRPGVLNVRSHNVELPDL